MPFVANQPAGISSANLAGAAAQCEVSVCGCMSEMLMIFPFSSIKATESGKRLLAIGLAWTENTRGAGAAPIIGRTTMKNPLDSLWGTVICGVILTLILHNIVSYALGG